MQIECPKCQTSYDVRDSSLGPEGRKVRCIRCEAVWFVEPSATGAAVPVRDATLSAEPGLPEPGHRAAPPAEHPEPGPAAVPDMDGPPAEESSPAHAELAEGPAHEAPVAIADAPSIIPPQELDPPFADGPDEPDNSGAAMSRHARLILNRKHHAKGFPLRAALVAALAAAVAALLIGRRTVVHYAPQTASLYEFIGLPVNLRGLTFANVKTLREIQDGTPILIVEGQIVSVSGQAVEVPRLRFALRNEKGQEVYSWTALAGRSILAPGDSMDFRSRLASPAADGSEVVVRFFNRRDLTASNQ